MTLQAIKMLTLEKSVPFYSVYCSPSHITNKRKTNHQILHGSGRAIKLLFDAIGERRVRVTLGDILVDSTLLSACLEHLPSVTIDR